MEAVHGFRSPRRPAPEHGDLHGLERPQALAAAQDLQVGGRAALGQHGDRESAFDGGDLAGEAGAVVDDPVVAALQGKGFEGAAFGEAGAFIYRDGQGVAPPDFELGRSDPDHGLVEQ